MKGLGKKGSTLVYMMVIVAILSLLGVTILSAALTGYQMRMAGGNGRKAFYIAEAGLEQANAIIEQTMRDAVDYARNQAQTKLDEEILKARVAQEKDRIDRSKSYGDKTKSPFFYHIYPAGSGNKNTFDFYQNITGEYNQYGNEVKPALGIIDPETNALKKVDSPEVNAVQGGVVQAYADKMLNKYFAEAYVSYLRNGNGSLADSLKKRLETEITFQSSDFENSNEKIAITSATVTDFGTLTQNADGIFPQTDKANTMSILFRSTGQAGNSAAGGISRTLETNFQLGIPPYDLPLVKGNEIVRLKANALFDKALCSDNDIIVMGNNVTVNGNVYAKGHDYSVSDTDSYRYGGIIVGDALAFNDEKLYGPLSAEKRITDLSIKTGSLTVNGTISTPSYLQTRNSNSHITANGKVYCNSLVAQQDWETDDNGVFANCDIILKDDLNILDNLNLNARDTKIEVDGNFFGFADGSGVTARHNQSSSIVINDEDIGLSTSRTSLTINGDGKPTEYSFVDEESGSSTPIYRSLPNGIYIGGTAYVNYGLIITLDDAHKPAKGSVTIDTDGKWTYSPLITPVADDFTDSFTLKVQNKTFGGTDLVDITVDKNKMSGVIASNFQTGDSVSIAGNYGAYRMKLNSNALKAVVGDTNVPAYFNYVDLPDVCFDSVAPLYLAQRLPGTDGSGNTIYNNMKATEKSLYARIARYQDKTSSTPMNYFNFGAGKVVLKSDNLRYSLGNFIENTSTTSDFQAMSSPKDSVHGLLGDAGYATYNIALKLKAREFSYYTKKLSDPQIINYLGKDPNSIKLETQSTISDFFTFPGGTLSNLAERRDGNNDPIYFVDGATTPRPVWISGENSSIPTQIDTSGFEKFNVTGSEGSVDGVIVTSGDVYISGSVNYKGIIAAKGKIYIFDNQTKTFTNDYNPNLLAFKTDADSKNDYSHMIDNISNNTVIKKILKDSLVSSNDLGDCFNQEGTVGSPWEKEIIFTKDVDNSVMASGQVNTYTSRLSEYVKVSQWKKSS